VLGDYFDYIAGTSTGAIIAACLACGMSVDEVLRFYVAQGPVMFQKASLLKRLYYEYEAEPLARELRSKLGRDAAGNDRKLGDESLRCLLLLVLRNFTTDSPWPLSNNPAAKYNDRDRSDCNLELPLWKLVRASAAAPTYFPPEMVRVGQKDFLFVDGGITTYNNPAFLLFLMSTLEPYRLCWPATEDQLLLVSVGTGTDPSVESQLGSGPNLLQNARSLPPALMYAALNQQDTLCRVFGRCVSGAELDSEIGDLCSFTKGPVERRLFRYVRYNSELTEAGMRQLDVPAQDPVPLRALDSIEHVGALRSVGQAIGRLQVQPSHFEGFVEVAQ